MDNREELLRILACPSCKGELNLRAAKNGCEGFECAACGVVYPIRDDIPVMLIEEAIPIEKWEA